ncbi:MAG: hypothetical protein JWN25_1052 [Verrucomicrobiales bacterium]|nr:hypothetical protein [Verrucomicrobiales bacterium]
MKTRALFAGIFLLLSLPSFAVDGFNISVQGSDVALRWQSKPNEYYIIQYRATLDPHDQWQTLTNAWTAATIGTNTTFVHSNIVCTPSEALSNYSGSGGSISFNSLSFGAALDLGSEAQMPPTPAFPPLPWASAFGGLFDSSSFSLSNSIDIGVESSFSTFTATTAAFAQNANSCDQIPTTPGVCSGFYRVFVPTPIARLDIFGVDQGSVSNKLAILANDEDRDDNPIRLSSVQSALHGTIEYNSDGSTFLYTPTSTFSGVDPFFYSITNDVGGSNSASVFVFINEEGNSHPTAPPLAFTLLTNQTVISFSMMTNTADVDGDNLQLVTIDQPTRGAVVTNTLGELIYTRTSRYIAKDSFYYVLTDGHGGFVKRNVAITPQDDDGDGIPDEWELLHGLDITRNDALEDPDGDGVPNIAEYLLDTCPNGADSPLNLGNIASNQTFRQNAQLPIPLKSYINSPAISFLINSNRADAVLRQRADGCWYILWDTSYLTNGSYTVGLQMQHNPNAQPPASTSIFGSTKVVIVTNDVRFKQLSSEFTDYLVFDVEMPAKTNYWRIEMYDVSNQHLGGFAGLTTNGTILGAWDLKNGQGNQIAFSHVKADFYTSPTSGSPTGGTEKKASRWFIKQTPNGIGDSFVAAWGWDTYGSSFQSQRTSLMLDGVLNIIGNPARSDAYQLLPVANVPYGSAFRMDDLDDKELLLNSLRAPNSGNFFWFGHGMIDAIQGNAKKASIAPGDIENELKNKKHRSTLRLPRVNEHPYRLVILNGCETYGAEWANAFGFDFSPNGTTNDVVAFSQQGRQSQAFVAWTKSIEVPSGTSSSLHQKYAEGLGYLFSKWMDGYALENCLHSYDVIMTINGFAGHDSWRISGTSVFYRSAP